MKKVYFACSIRGGRDDAEIYESLVGAIRPHAVVLTEIFADQKLTPQGMNKPAPEIWETDLAWVREADVLIAEVTNPSLGVGYEIAKAEEWGKPILALYRPSPERKLSAMILGSPHVTNHEYATLEEAAGIITNFLSSTALQ
jgi:2'-deoxynucleoside 5'-phosphate N-hydrolase